MCSSPHEMTTEQIEYAVQQMRGWVENGDDYWAWRLEQFEKLLKERAEAGTY